MNVFIRVYFMMRTQKRRGEKNFKTIFEILAQKMIGKIENKVDHKIHEERWCNVILQFQQQMWKLKTKKELNDKTWW